MERDTGREKNGESKGDRKKGQREWDGYGGGGQGSGGKTGKEQGRKKRMARGHARTKVLHSVSNFTMIGICCCHCVSAKICS